MNTSPLELKNLYKKGHNIAEYLRNELGLTSNTPEIIEISYDLQTGSYINLMKTEKMIKHKAEYSAEISKIVLSLCSPESILEAGVGEATTFSGVLSGFGKSVQGFGFDLSWSRVAFAMNWLKGNGIHNYSLSTGSLINIPFLDDSIDVVYTSHSIEPNGGDEKDILLELYRVARKYLVLLEPGYEFASAESRKRMDSHGYCKNLYGICKSLGYKVIEYKEFPFSAVTVNPTQLIVIEKCSEGDAPEQKFACPSMKSPLEMINGMMYSHEALVVYPIIGGIPCLRKENGVLASKYSEIMSASLGESSTIL